MIRPKITSINLTHVVGLSLTTIFLLLGVSTSLFPNIEHKIQLILAIFISTLVLWITKPVPYVISSLLSIVLIHAFKLVPSFEGSVSGFTSDLVFFMIMLLFIGKGVDNADFDKWVANQLVSSKSTPKNTVYHLSLTILVLIFVMPSGIARTATFMPTIDEVNNIYEMDDNSQFRRLSYYIIGHLNPIGSLALMTGGGSAIAAAEMVNSSVQSISWLEWALYMSPPIILIMTFSVITISKLYNVNDREKTGLDMNTTEYKNFSYKSLNSDQKIVIGTLFVAIFFWGVGSFIGIPTIVPAMLSILVFSLPHIRIITYEDIHSINWDIIFLIGTTLSIFEVMREVNALDFMVRIFISKLPLDLSPIIILATLFTTAIIIRGTFSSVTVAFIVLFPILLEFSLVINSKPLYLAFGLAILLMSTTFFPFNNPTVLLAYERGPLNMREVFLLGMITLGISLIIVVISWTTYWPFIDTILKI